MHPISSLALLAPLAAVQVAAVDNAQIPLTDKAKGWFSAAKDYIPTAVPAIPGLSVPTAMPTAIRNPINAAAAKVAAKQVTPLTMDNYDTFLSPDAAKTVPTEFMVYVTGGNKTCGGHCHNLDIAWNETASVFAADPTAPRLAVIDCEHQSALCATWSARPPTIWHIARPAPASPKVGDMSPAATEIRISYLNFTTSTAQDMIALHTGKKYQDGYLLEGFFHPFDGMLAQYGLLKPAGYALNFLSLVPSWAIMIAISMGSRFFIAKRNQPIPARNAAGGAPRTA